MISRNGIHSLAASAFFPALLRPCARSPFMKRAATGRIRQLSPCASSEQNKLPHAKWNAHDSAIIFPRPASPTDKIAALRPAILTPAAIRCSSMYNASRRAAHVSCP